MNIYVSVRDGIVAECAGSRLLAYLLACVVFLQPRALSGEPIPVRYTEGLIHGFLVLRTLEGEVIAEGDLTQVVKGARVTSHLIFRFKDGSVHEETTVFSQHGTFRLLRSHVVQKGPTFKHPMETSLDGSTGQITVRYADDDGNEKALAERLDLPSDVANGMIFTLLKNVQPNQSRTKVSMVTTTPKPRLVKLVITPQGEEPFSIGGSKRKATHYVVKFEIGGATGLMAPLVGKQPPDIHVWVVGGEVPAFVKSEGPLYEGGPSWRIELACPVGPQTPATGSSKEERK